MSTLRISSDDGSSAAAVESFILATAFVLPDPLPLPRCLYAPLDPVASDSQLYQRLRRFVASPLYQRLRRFVASSLYQRLRRFVASSLYQRIRRFVASSLRRFVASSLRRFTAFAVLWVMWCSASVARGVKVSVYQGQGVLWCSGCQGPWVLLCSRYQGLGVKWVSRSGVSARGFCCVRGVNVRGCVGGVMLGSESDALGAVLAACDGAGGRGARCGVPRRARASPAVASPAAASPAGTAVFGDGVESGGQAAGSGPSHKFIGHLHHFGMSQRLRRFMSCHFCLV
jgi:hypothetical protein